MDYRIYDKNDSSQAVATAQFADDFQAETWARKWAAENGKSDDYRIEREEGGFSARLFKTAGAQWYIMRQ